MISHTCSFFNTLLPIFTDKIISPAENYHNKEQSYITALNEDDSSCRVCHKLYLHKKNNTVRAFLNMHTGFLVCETCHIKRDDFENLTYNWKDSENVVFSGSPFGSFYNPLPGKAGKSRNLISRIAVFAGEKGEAFQYTSVEFMS